MQVDLAQAATLRKNGVHLGLFEKVRSRAVAPHVEVVLDAAAALEAHLRQVAVGVVAKENRPSPGLQVGRDLRHYSPVVGRVDGGENEDHRDDVERTGGKGNACSGPVRRGEVEDEGTEAVAVS